MGNKYRLKRKPTQALAIITLLLGISASGVNETTPIVYALVVLVIMLINITILFKYGCKEIIDD